MYSIRFLVLFWLFCTIGISNVNSSTKIKNTIRKYTADRIVEKNDQNGAEDMFKKFKVGDQNRLCTSIDGKTNHIYAYGICKEVLERLFEVKPVIKDLYEEKENKDFKVTFVITGIGSNIAGFGSMKQFSKVKQAVCKYGDDIKVHVAHATENFYYVSKANGDLQAFLNIPLKKSDYPKISVKETKDRVQADNIFGFHGVGTFTIPKGTSELDKVRQNRICNVAMRKLELEKANNLNTCTKSKLTRYIPNVCTGCAKKTKQVDCLECYYKFKFATGVYTRTLKLFNAPEDYLYYAARLLEDFNPDPSSEKKLAPVFSVYQIISIQPMEMVLSEFSSKTQPNPQFSSF